LTIAWIVVSAPGESNAVVLARTGGDILAGHRKGIVSGRRRGRKIMTHCGKTCSKRIGFRWNGAGIAEGQTDKSRSLFIDLEMGGQISYDIEVTCGHWHTFLEVVVEDLEAVVGR
jgi:hypothetical protein